MMKNLLKKTIYVFSALICQNINAQCFDCGTGADGVYLATTNTTLAGGTYNYSSFTINSGVVVTVTGNQPLIIKCNGNVTINGSLLANGGNGGNGVTFSTFGVGGIGVAGGSNGGNGVYIGSPSPGVNGSGPGGGGGGAGWSGGGGAGYATVGASSGGVGGFGGPQYGNIQVNPLVGGSGGGGGSGGNSCGSGGGGAGGGVIAITACGTLTIGTTGIISANGGNGGSDGTGNCGGGAGGSGGSLWLSAPTVTHQGVLSATGGNGGASTLVGPPYYGVGGVGAPGRIRLDRNTLSGNGTSNPAVGFTMGVPVNQLSVVTTNSPVLCFGGSTGMAGVSASGGVGPYTYLWSPGNQTTNVITGQAAGTYTCVVTDAQGCTTSSIITITQPTQLVVSCTDATICEGNCATITGNAIGGTAGYTYSWSTAQTTSSINPCPTVQTSYVFYVTDANGCTSSNTATVFVNALPAVSYVQNPSIFCINWPVTTLTAGSPSNGTYSGTAVTANTFDPAAAGQGTFNIVYSFTDGNGCTNSDTSVVVVDLCTGVDFSNASANQPDIYPNPTSGKCIITINEDALVMVYNVLGENVYNQKHNKSNNMLDLSTLPNGVYNVTIQTQTSTNTARVTLKK